MLKEAEDAESAGPEDPLASTAAQEDVTSKERRIDAPGKSLEDPAAAMVVAERHVTTGGVDPKEILRNAAAQNNGSANDELEMDHKLTKEIRGPLKIDAKDMDKIEKDESKELLKNWFTQAGIVLGNNWYGVVG